MDYRLECKYKSSDFRSKNGIGAKDPIPFKALLSKLSILCVFKPLSDEISGMVGQLKKVKFMLINSNHSIGRQNFTIAHEIYHIFYDKYFKTTIVDFKNDNEGEEKKANTFASYLILPEDGLIDLIPEKEKSKNRITIQTLVKIEQYYQASRRALLFRLKNMNFIDDKYIEKNNNSIINQARMLGYDISLYLKGNENVVIGEYTSLAKVLYDNDIISESNYIDYLIDIGINPKEIELNAFEE